MLASLDLSQSWQEGVNGFSETLLSGAGVFDCLNSSAKVIGVPWKDVIVLFDSKHHFNFLLQPRHTTF